jgi:beta-carotene hydroxylase
VTEEGTIVRRLQEAVGPRPFVDGPTAALIGLMAAGFPLTGVLYQHGMLPAWAALLIGSALMNLSFTAWHEPAHQTFSRWRSLNSAAGWLASLLSVYPGYFARRREHLIHHRFEGQEGKDPVFPRIQSSAWTFPLALLRTALLGAPLQVPASVLPITRVQRAADALSNLLALAVVVTAAALGYFQTILWVWLGPRLVIYALHAYYICYFPHSVPGGGYQVLRVRQDHAWLRLLTVNQHLHGIHHRWPWIPWHRYRRVLRDCADELRRESLLASPLGEAPVVAGRGGSD